MAHTLYSYRDIRVIHMEPTSKCQAACPMCGRNQRGGRTRKNIDLCEITLADFQDWFAQPFLQQLSAISMCGNFGDPIIARDCLPMLEHARQAKRTLHLHVNTNGSARNAAFWQDLAGLGAHVNFAIDGATAESHIRYRRHTNFEAILQNAETFVAAGGTAIWDMLVFQHNQHEVEAAQVLAEKIGFSKFFVKSTNRFYGREQIVEDIQGETVDRLFPSDRYPSQYLANLPPESDLEDCQIDCKVKAKNSVYVSASGLAFPCCWLGAAIVERPGRPDAKVQRPDTRPQLASYFELIDLIGEANLDLRQTPLAVIVNRYFPHFARRWAEGPDRLHTCAHVCGKFKFDKFKSTFVAETTF